MSFWDGLNLQYSKHPPRYTVWARDLQFHKKVPFLTGNEYASRTRVMKSKYSQYFTLQVKLLKTIFSSFYTSLLDIPFMQILNRFVEKNIIFYFTWYSNAVNIIGTSCFHLSHGLVTFPSTRTKPQLYEELIIITISWRDDHQKKPKIIHLSLSLQSRQQFKLSHKFK